MWRAIISLGGMALAACGAPIVKAPSAPTGEQVAFGAGPGGASDACFTCHGLEGEGDGVAPRLAGQSAGYLIKQMEDYASKWRNHPQMSAIAARLGDGDRISVARYYASVGSPRSNPNLSSLVLFHQGDVARGIAKCAQCHGSDAMGGLAAPRLAGQTEEYIRAQLLAFRASERRNDPEDVMGAMARRLTAAEIETLAAQIAAMP